jgi:hypothetical protein
MQSKREDKGNYVSRTQKHQSDKLMYVLDCQSYMFETA